MQGPTNLILNLCTVMQQVAGAKYVFASFRSLLKLQNVDGP
jgi:hypothetical protein